MTLAISLFLLAQAAAGTVGDSADLAKTGSNVTRTSSGGAVASATASARVLRPVSVRVMSTDNSVKIDTRAANTPQTERDPMGTLWIEFS
ncbi:MAG: hypothetical protein AAFN04_06725 [Pseudomonadota bacterium]